MVSGWNMFILIFLKHRFHILNSTPNSTGRHYTKYRFSPDIDWHMLVFLVDTKNIFIF